MEIFFNKRKFPKVDLGLIMQMEIEKRYEEQTFPRTESICKNFSTMLARDKVVSQRLL